MASRDSKSLYIAFASLVGLLIATIALNFVPFGAAHVWIGLGIAAIKTVVVVLVFMGLTQSPGAARLAAGASLLWLSFAIILVMSDYMTRGWDETQQHKLTSDDYLRSYDRVEDTVPPAPAAAKSQAE